MMQTALKRPGGRPTKYNDELVRKAQDYLETYQDSGHKLPTIAGLSLSLGINKETANVWRKDKNKRLFSVVCDQIALIQESILIDNGLDNSWNSNLTKLLLSKHGYTDNPQANQGNSGITVNVNRGGVTVQAGSQSVSIETNQASPGVTIEHELGTIDHE